MGLYTLWAPELSAGCALPPKASRVWGCRSSLALASGAASRVTCKTVGRRLLHCGLRYSQGDMSHF